MRKVPESWRRPISVEFHSFKRARAKTIRPARSALSAAGIDTTAMVKETKLYDALGVTPDAVRTRVFDGQFELRVAAQAAEASAPVQGAARTVILMWMAGGLVGWWMLSISRVTTFLVWGITLLLGAWSLRRGLVSGRTMLAARLAVALEG